MEPDALDEAYIEARMAALQIGAKWGLPAAVVDDITRAIYEAVRRLTDSEHADH